VGCDVKGFFGALFLMIGISNSAQSVIILSDALGDLQGASFVRLPNYLSALCSNCTNEHLLGRALGAVDFFPDNTFAQIAKGKSYIAQVFKEEESPLDIDETLKSMSELFRVLRKSANKDAGIYEKALLKELISNEAYLSQIVVDEIARVMQKVHAFEVQTKVALIERNGVAPTDAEVLNAMCPFFKGESCKTKYNALLSLNRFFTQIIEQLSLGMRVGKNGSTLYGALQARLKKLESAAK